MIFTLEALRARQGDALLLHYGTADKPRLSIIDGGPGGVFGDALRPRLIEIRNHLAADPLPVDLIMVSHLDDDHIGGLLQLTDELLQSPNTAPWLTTKTIWCNTFADLADDQEDVLHQAQAPNNDAAHVVSVGQGRKMRANAELLAWRPNVPFGELVQAPPSGGRSVMLDPDTELLVIGPREDQIVALRQKWAEEMVKIKKKEKKVGEVVEFLDDSEFNLSSIVCLARQDGRSMLLTGDARGDHVLSGLEAAGAMTNGAIHVDILKLPHHGSIRNLEKVFFDHITADHYVISANGKDGNPETESLELITGSRDAGARYTIHLTYEKGLEDLDQRIAAFRAEHANVEPRADSALSLKIDLADPLAF